MFVIITFVSPSSCAGAGGQKDLYYVRDELLPHRPLLTRPVRPVVDVVAHGGALKEAVHPVAEPLQQLLLKQDVAVVV